MVIKYKFQNHFEIKKRKKFLDDNAQKTFEDEKFIFFPLMGEPEARVLTIAPFYSNQVSVIENIAKSIPIDHVLYVKEHPSQKEKLWRPIENYEKIINIPNVTLIHPEANSQELISKSQAVISITGSTGFEALFYKKPVIIFVDEYYDVISSVSKANSFSELNEKIKNALSNFRFDNKELNVLVHAIENQTITVPYYSIIKDGVTISAIQRYENSFDLTLDFYEKFYEKFREHFKLIAETMYSKSLN